VKSGFPKEKTFTDPASINNDDAAPRFFVKNMVGTTGFEPANTLILQRFRAFWQRIGKGGKILEGCCRGLACSVDGSHTNGS
jgi:hypothetical protein